MTNTQWKLVTVNTAPERAKIIIGRVVEDVKDRFSIAHAGNAESIEQVKEVVERERPNLLFTASMWTPEQAQEIIDIAKGVIPHLKTFSLPQGLQATKGPDGVVEYIEDKLPDLLGDGKEVEG